MKGENEIESNWFELNWIEWDWIELHWDDLHPIGLHWIQLDWIGLDWNGMNWIEMNWIEVDWSGLNWIDFNWMYLQLQSRAHTELLAWYCITSSDYASPPPPINFSMVVTGDPDKPGGFQMKSEGMGKVTFQKKVSLYSFRIIGDHHFWKAPFSLSEKYCFEKHNFLTFDINGIDAFSKVIIPEESTALPGLR